MRNATLLIITVLFLTSFTPAQQTYIVKKGYTVALSKASYDKMMDAVSNQDNAYFQKLIDNAEIVTLPNDIEAYLVESFSFKGYNVMRIKGKDVKIWTLSESVKKK